MRPIPRNLLIHSATLYDVSTDRWQSETDSMIANLSFVRIERSSKIIITANNTEKQLTAEIIYDCRNSLPRGVTFLEGQKIVFNDIAYRIESINGLYDGHTLHHIEVGLI